MFNTAKKLDKLIKFLGLEMWNNNIERNPNREDRQIVDKRDLNRLKEDIAFHLQTLSNDIIEDRKIYLELTNHIEMLKDFLNVKMVPYIDKEIKSNMRGEVNEKDVIKYKYIKQQPSFSEEALITAEKLFKKSCKKK